MGSLAELYRVLTADLALWRDRHPGEEPVESSDDMPVVRRLHGVAMEFMAEDTPPPYSPNPEATAAMNEILKSAFPGHAEWQLDDAQVLALMVLMRHTFYKPLAPYYPLPIKAW
jgi:hypothetical protein